MRTKNMDTAHITAQTQTRCHAFVTALSVEKFLPSINFAR